jgi:hypothetical protein
MCLGVWFKLGIITDSDIRAAVVGLPELNEEDDELDVDWDRI